MIEMHKWTIRRSGGGMTVTGEIEYVGSDDTKRNIEHKVTGATEVRAIEVEGAGARLYVFDAEGNAVARLMV